MIDSFVDGFKSAFTWHMVGQTLGQLIIAIALIIIIGTIAALLRSN